MPGKYLEFIKFGRYVVPIEMTFLSTTCEDNGRNVVTSKWANRNDWKEIKTLLKPAAEFCVIPVVEGSSTKTHIAYGTGVGVGYMLCVDTANETSPFIGILDTQRNCWTDDEDDYDGLSNLYGPPDCDINRGRSQMPIQSRAYIRATVIRRTSSSLNDSRRLRKELTFKREESHCYKKPPTSPNRVRHKDDRHRTFGCTGLGGRGIPEASTFVPGISLGFDAERHSGGVISRKGGPYYLEPDEESNDGYMAVDLPVDAKTDGSDDDNLSLPDIDAPSLQPREIHTPQFKAKTNKLLGTGAESHQVIHRSHGWRKRISHYNNESAQNWGEASRLVKRRTSQTREVRSNKMYSSVERSVKKQLGFPNANYKNHGNTAEALEEKFPDKIWTNISRGRYTHTSETLDNIEVRMRNAASQVLRGCGGNSEIGKRKKYKNHPTGKMHKYARLITISTEAEMNLNRCKPKMHGKEKELTENMRYGMSDNIPVVQSNVNLTKIRKKRERGTRVTPNLDIPVDVEQTLKHRYPTHVDENLSKVKENKKTTKRCFKSVLKPETITTVVSSRSNIDGFNLSNASLIDLALDPEMPILIPESAAECYMDESPKSLPLLTPSVVGMQPVVARKRPHAKAVNSILENSTNNIDTLESIHTLRNADFPYGVADSGTRKITAIDSIPNDASMAGHCDLGVVNMSKIHPIGREDIRLNNSTVQNIPKNKSVFSEVESSQMMPPPTRPAPRTPKKSFVNENPGVNTLPYFANVAKSSDQSQPSKLSTLQIMWNPSILCAGVGLLKTLSNKNIATGSKEDQNRGGRVRELSPDITELPVIVGNAKRTNHFSDMLESEQQRITAIETDRSEEDLSDDEDPNPYEGETLIRELLSRVHENSNSYEPEGDGYDLSQKSMCYLNIIPEYSRKSRIFKIHCKKITDLTYEKLEEHYLSIRPALRQIFEGEVPNVRSITYLQGPAGIKRLQEMSVSIPFDHDQTSTIITMLLQYFIPDNSDRPKWSDYISYVLLPEALINIYARVNEIPYEMAEKEMQFQACYDDAVS